MEVELKVKFTRNEHGDLEPQVEVVGEDTGAPEV